MPTTDLDNSAGWANWLQSLVQNQGASAPYGPGGAPGPYSGGPNGLMPGGQVLGYHGTTPGQPSMGYPAVGQAAGRPSVAPGTQAPAAQSPIMQALSYLNPISSAQAQEAEPGVWNMRHSMPAGPTLPPAKALPPGPANSLPLASGNPTAKDYSAWLQSQLAAPPKPSSGPGFTMPPVNSAQFGGDTGGVDLTGSSVTMSPPPAATPAAAGSGSGGIGSDANFPVMGVGGFPTTYGAPGQQPPPIAGPLAASAQPHRPVTPTPATAYRPAATPAATSTAPPSAAPNAFGMIDRPNMSATGFNPGDRMMTALNLARLLGRG